VSGILISPQEALAVGLIDALAPTDQVIDRAIHWCETLIALPAEAMSATRREARKDLVACFGPNTEVELQGVAESWWSPETQNALRALTARLGKKPVAV
jgi:enoyl-CoA hydratase/carnithine racemase